MGAVPVSAWLWRAVSELQFLPTHADGTRSAGWISQNKPGQENAEALAPALGFGKVPSQEQGRYGQRGVAGRLAANPSEQLVPGKHLYFFKETKRQISSSFSWLRLKCQVWLLPSSSSTLLGIMSSAMPWTPPALRFPVGGMNSCSSLGNTLLPSFLAGRCSS